MQACATMGCLAFCFMYAIFIPSPGDSWPGRFLCPLIPILAVLISLWAHEPYALRWRSLAPVSAGRGGYVVFIGDRLQQPAFQSGCSAMAPAYLPAHVAGSKGGFGHRRRGSDLVGYWPEPCRNAFGKVFGNARFRRAQARSRMSRFFQPDP